MGNLPVKHVCTECHEAQIPARPTKYSRTSYCWVCEAETAKRVPCRKMTEGELAAFRIGGHQAVREMLSAQAQGDER